MIAILVILIGLYCFLILLFIIGYFAVPTLKFQKTNPQISFSIIIPFRNEAKNLRSLLDSISQLSYPSHLVEFIFVNDASEDDFQSIFDHCLDQESINFKLMHLNTKSKSPKKEAINLAIGEAAFDWIITTDADVVLPTKWLLAFDQLITTTSPNMIVAPVKIVPYPSFLSYFQALDFMSLQGSTLGGFGLKIPFLCNGANLAYQKKMFLSLKGFEGNDCIATGDDLFLMHKFLNHQPTKVTYLKSRNVIVATRPVQRWHSLVSQRLRWASKTSALNHKLTTIIGSIVFLGNLSWLLLLVFALIQLITWQLFLMAFGVKFLIDFILIFQVAIDFKQVKALRLYLLSSLIHPIFITTTALLSFKKTYTWKGRSFQH